MSVSVDGRYSQRRPVSAVAPGTGTGVSRQGTATRMASRMRPPRISRSAALSAYQQPKDPPGWNTFCPSEK